MIYARRREEDGTRACSKLRKTGRTPAILFSLPFNESQLISLDTKQVTTLVSSSLIVHALVGTGVALDVGMHVPRYGTMGGAAWSAGSLSCSLRRKTGRLSVIQCW